MPHLFLESSLKEMLQKNKGINQKKRKMWDVGNSRFNPEKLSSCAGPERATCVKGSGTEAARESGP